MDTFYNVVIGDDSKFADDLSKQLRDDGFGVTRVSCNPLDIQFEAMTEKPRAIFLNRGVKGFETLLNNLMKINPLPFLYVITGNSDEFGTPVRSNMVTAVDRSSDVDKTISALTARLNAAEDMNEPYTAFLHNYISELLARLCITPNYNGYSYLREAIKIAVMEPDNPRSFSKIIYPRISRKFSVTPTGIERNIRTVISKGWNKASLTDKECIFGSCAVRSEWRPTNCEFILMVAEKILRRTSAFRQINV